MKHYVPNMTLFKAKDYLKSLLYYLTHTSSEERSEAVMKVDTEIGTVIIFSN